MKKTIDIGAELRLIRRALQALVAIQRADAKRVAAYDREAKAAERKLASAKDWPAPETRAERLLDHDYGR